MLNLEFCQGRHLLFEFGFLAVQRALKGGNLLGALPIEFLQLFQFVLGFVLTSNRLLDFLLEHSHFFGEEGLLFRHPLEILFNQAKARLCIDPFGCRLVNAGAKVLAEFGKVQILLIGLLKVLFLNADASLKVFEKGLNLFDSAFAGKQACRAVHRPNGQKHSAA